MNKKNSLFLFIHCSSPHCVFSLTLSIFLFFIACSHLCCSSILHLVLTLLGLHFFFFHLTSNGRMPHLLFLIFSCFLPPTLFTSNHNKCKPLILTLFQSKSLSSILIGRVVLLGSFLFSSACSTLFAYFSLREVRLLTSYGRQKWHAH